MKLALIPYVNTAPFHFGMDPAWVKRQELVREVPSSLGELGRRGAVDAGIFSLVDFWELHQAGLYEPLDALGVAGYGGIRSILLFGVEHPQDLEGLAVAITPHTRTTVRLLDAWLRLRIRLSRFHLVGMEEGVKPTLLIGDPCLSRLLKHASGEPRPWDLCEEWTRWTGKGFVFSRWAVRRGLPAQDKAELLDQLRRSLDLSLSSQGLKELTLSEAARTGFPPDFIRAYLSGIRFRLGDCELEGAALFQQMLGMLPGAGHERA
jgi:predicted solute-binding protein